MTLLGTWGTQNYGIVLVYNEDVELGKPYLVEWIHRITGKHGGAAFATKAEALRRIEIFRKWEK